MAESGVWDKKSTDETPTALYCMRVVDIGVGQADCSQRHVGNRSAENAGLENNGPNSGVGKTAGPGGDKPSTIDGLSPPSPVVTPAPLSGRPFSSPSFSIVLRERRPTDRPTGRVGRSGFVRLTMSDGCVADVATGS